MAECIFCKIARGEIPSKKVFENDQVIVFHDIKPVAPVHVLIVPKKHVSDLLSLEQDANGPAIAWTLFQAAAEAAGKLGVDKKGFRLINNCGEDGGQTVDHIHLHLIGGKPLGEGLI